MEFLDGVSVCDQNGNKREKSGTQRQNKTIWTEMANLDKIQGLKWQFTLFLIIFIFYIYVNTLTKYPPANMKAITVTEAKVVALFKSVNVAPIANPSPCHYSCPF
ncbi:hypothetical protein Hanom_Chr01g00083501 [Helianthus anomalus]